MLWEKVRGHIRDAWGLLLKLRKITDFSLWENFTSYFPNLTTNEILNDLMNLKEIAMPAFIDYVHNIGKQMSMLGQFLPGRLLWCFLAHASWFWYWFLCMRNGFVRKWKHILVRGQLIVVVIRMLWRVPCQLLRMGWYRQNMIWLLGANPEGSLLLHQTRRKRRCYWLRWRIWRNKMYFEREMVMNSMETTWLKCTWNLTMSPW